MSGFHCVNVECSVLAVGGGPPLTYRKGVGVVAVCSKALSRLQENRAAYRAMRDVMYKQFGRRDRREEGRAAAHTHICVFIPRIEFDDLRCDEAVFGGALWCCSG